MNGIDGIDTTLLVAQALGFATGAILCCFLAVMQWQTGGLANARRFSVIWLSGLLWTSGRFANQMLILAGWPAGSAAWIVADAIAYCSPCMGTIVVAQVMDRLLEQRYPWRRTILSVAISVGVVTLTLLMRAAFQPEPFAVFRTLSRFTFYLVLVQFGVGTALFLLRQRKAGQPSEAARYWRAVMLLFSVPMALIAVGIGAPVNSTLRTTSLLLSQQWVIPVAVWLAITLAKTHYADVVLKRSLTVVGSVAMAAAVVWHLPGLQLGIDTVWLSLAGAVLLMIAPSGYHALEFCVDRLLLRRPAYRPLLQQFVAQSRRTANQEELLALASRCVDDALHAEARFVADHEPVSPAQATTERIVLRGQQSAYRLLLTPHSGARALLQAEHLFLDGVAAETGYRLEALEFERERSERRLREERLQHAATQAELRALRAQVDPHFLFNTLNTITELISTDAQLAETMTERLCRFFRYTLSRQDRLYSTLDEELEFVRHYLDIEQVRFSERLRVEIRKDDGLGQQIVPSLLLQPLVENSVRHGLAPKLGGGSVIVTASRNGDQVCLLVADDGVGIRADNNRLSSRGHGVGLQNVRERLRALYGDAAQVSVDSAPDQGTRIKLLFPFDAQP
jgi:two-component system, LytTR family, sensor kinase